METLISQFSELVTKLPPETDRVYEKQMTALAQKCHTPQWEAALMHMVESRHNNAYEAFFVLCTIYRRNKDFRKLGTIIHDYDYFWEHPSYNHIVIMYHVHSESFYDYDELLEMAYLDAENFRDNAGYLHTFANSFATICENCNDDDRKVIISRWYSRARDAIDTALRLEPYYAKFYCTKGRIISANEEYAAGLAMIREAISLEESSRPDYPLTISNYQYYRLLITSRSQNRELSRRLQQLERLLEGLKVPASMELPPAPTAYSGEDAYAFVSYAHADSREVYGIVEKLNDLGKRVWYDGAIEPGAEWSEVLGEKISNCSVFLLMLSNNAINSLNVRKEFNMALSLGKPIIAIVLEQVSLTPGMCLQLQYAQMIEKFKRSPKDFEQQLQQIPLEFPADGLPEEVTV